MMDGKSAQDICLGTLIIFSISCIVTRDKALKFVSAKRPLNHGRAKARLKLQCVVNHWTSVLVYALRDALSHVARQTLRLYQDTVLTIYLTFL